MKKFLADFKKFAAQGNVMDMAVGIIIGTAFKDVVNSFVADIIMPALSILIGKIDFNTWVWTPYVGIDIKYGVFIQKIIDFMLIAFCIFLFIRIITNIREKAEAGIAKLKKDAKPGEVIETVLTEQPVAAPLTQTEILLTEIKELLQKQADSTSKN